MSAKVRHDPALDQNGHESVSHSQNLIDFLNLHFNLN